MITTLAVCGVCLFLFIIIFTAFEAFDRLSGGRILKLEEHDPVLADKLASWLEKADPVRGVFKLLMFILASLLGIFSFVLIREYTGHDLASWRILFMVGAIIVFWAVGEISSLLLLSRSDLWVLRLTIPPVLLIAHTVLLPFTFLSGKLRENVEDWRDEENPDQKVSAEDEILSVVENYGEHDNDDLEEDEKRMIKGILDLGDMSVREIMTPRVDITAIPVTATLQEARKVFLESGHSRIPVYGRSVDEIRGIVYAKDFIDERAIAGKTLDMLAHKPLFIPESKEVGELLKEIRKLHNHFAVIIDEYGGTSGIVTFEDIIEEIVGDVQDEFDNEEEEKNKPLQMPDGFVLFEARTPIPEVNEILNSHIPEGESADTVGGYICSELGRIPEDGEEFLFAECGLLARIVRADKRRILSVKIGSAPKTEEG